MKSKKNKIIAILASGVMLCSMAIVPNTQGESILASTGIVQTVEADASGVVRGCFNGDSWSGQTTVYIANNRKKAKIKVCAFRQNGKINGGKFKVEVTADGGYKKTYSVSGSGYITLNAGFSKYNIRIIRNNPWSSNKANDNRAKTIYWSIDGTTNCNV